MGRNRSDEGEAGWARVQAVEQCISTELSRAELLEAFVACLRMEGCPSVTVTLGWGTHLAPDALPPPVSVTLDDCAAYIDSLESAGSVTLGESDVFVVAAGYEFRMCHDGDLHLLGSGPIRRIVLERWTTSGRLAYSSG